jgi:hypothetical protein
MHSPSPALRINFKQDSKVGFIVAQRSDLIASRARAETATTQVPVLPVLSLAPSTVKLRQGKHARKRSEHRVSSVLKRKSKRKSLPLAIDNIEEVLKRQHAEQLKLAVTGSPREKPPPPVEEVTSPRERRFTVLRSPREKVRQFLQPSP